MNKSNIYSTSQSKIPHVFFQKNMSNNLSDLSQYLLNQYEKISNGKIVKESETYDAFDYTESISTMRWNQYNLFQFYNNSIFDLFLAVVDMTKFACDYYKIDFYKERYMAHSWFNVNYKNKGRLDWHDHSDMGAPLFHGYYSVNAEPSETFYKIFGEDVCIKNKNNMAILSEMGHPHCVGEWKENGPRITIAYDVMPLRYIEHSWEQHWIPLS
jgi:hypothetical protein